MMVMGRKTHTDLNDVGIGSLSIGKQLAYAGIQ